MFYDFSFITLLLLLLRRRRSLITKTAAVCQQHRFIIIYHSVRSWRCMQCRSVISDNTCAPVSAAVTLCLVCQPPLHRSTTPPQVNHPHQLSVTATAPAVIFNYLLRLVTSHFIIL